MHELSIFVMCSYCYHSCTHGCQNDNLDRRITQFYDPTSPKHLGSHENRKNSRIVWDPIDSTDPTKT